MADADDQPDDAAKAKTDAMALAEQAEAEAAEAEALAAAARARARAIRLRRQAEAEAESAEATTATTATAPMATESADATPEAPEAPVAPAEPTRRWRPGPKVYRALALATVVVICCLLTASAYMMWHHHTAIEQRQRAAAFVAAAKQGVINMTSLDFNKAKADVQRVIDSSTGEFRDDFQKRAGDFTTVVEQSKVVTEGAVKATAVESMGKDSAVVLVLGTERVTNAAGAKDEPRSFRLRVSVARDGDQIKMSKVEFVL